MNGTHSMPKLAHQDLCQQQGGVPVVYFDTGQPIHGIGHFGGVGRMVVEYLLEDGIGVNGFGQDARTSDEDLQVSPSQYRDAGGRVRGRGLFEHASEVIGSQKDVRRVVHVFCVTVGDMQGDLSGDLGERARRAVNASKPSLT